MKSESPHSPPPGHASRGPCGRPFPSDPDALLYPAEAAHLMALSERTLEGMRVRGGGPTFCRLQRSVRYRRADVVAWIAARRVDSTSTRLNDALR